jgi:hypothetical protein
MAKSRKNVRKSRKSLKRRNSRKSFRKISGGEYSNLKYFADQYCDGSEEKCQNRIKKYISHILNKYNRNANKNNYVDPIDDDTINPFVDFIINCLKATMEYDIFITTHIKPLISQTTFKFKDDKSFPEMFKYENIEYYLQTYQKGFEEGFEEGRNELVNPTVIEADQPEENK